MDDEHRIFELRRYRLKPGRREDLIELFDGEFVDSQETTGMRVVAQFRDIGAPDEFVWLRSFETMESRAQSLASFYGGPVWKMHGPAANDTMVNSDNVLLLRPAPDQRPFSADHGERGKAGGGVILSTIYSLAPGAAGGFIEFFRQSVAPVIERASGRLDAVFETEPAANSFPRLPVRAGETVVVTFVSYPDATAYAEAVGHLSRQADWRDRIKPSLNEYLWRAPEEAMLVPTRQSRFRGDFAPAGADA